MYKKYIITFLLFISGTPLYAQHNAVPPTDEFRVVGEVGKELHVNMKALLQFTQESLGDVVIKNKKGEQKSVAKQMKGVLLKTVLDSADIHVDKPKEYGRLYIALVASDDYKNVYSWNELFNTDIGNHVYIITEMDGKPIDQMADRILVVSLSDYNSGSRHLKGLARIEVKKI